MEQNSRTRLKALLSGIAVVLLGIHLLGMVGMALQQNGATGTTVALPTLSGERAQVDTSVTVCTATVKVRLLNQRSGPGENYEVTGGASNGERFAIEGQDQTQQWLLVSATSGSVWMYTRYMAVSGNCEKLPVYEAASGASSASVETEITVVAITPTPRQQVAEPNDAESSVSGSITTVLSTVFTAEVQFWESEITAWSATYQIDPNLIATVIQIESCGNPSVHSSAGAQGLFQVMPFHFTQGENMLDVETNARRGLDYLQGALKLAQNNVELALAGYNGGYGVIYGRWATETQHYAYWGSNIYSEASSGAASSKTLAEWLAAGGSSLCESASQVQQMMV